MHAESLLSVRSVLVLVAIVMAGAVGCRGAENGGEVGPVAETMVDAPRVFFASPTNETDHPTELPLMFTFGVENFEIDAVPEEFLMPRNGVGHFHLGINTECLPVGELVPESDPWIHLGDGSDGMELMLEPGEYRFTVQIGDDEHRTLEGFCPTCGMSVGPLCETITVGMESGI